MPEINLKPKMSDKKRKRGRPRVAPVLSYGSEMKMRNNVSRIIKKPKYLREQDEEDSISRGSTPARSIDNVSIQSRSSINGGRSRNSRGYNPDIDDKDSEYHYGSDFEVEEESDEEKVTPGIDSRSNSEVTSDIEESEIDELNVGETVTEGDNLGLTEAASSFVPFWKLGPAGTLGFRPHTPVPVWLQDREYPELELPESSDDLLMPQPFILQAVGIYEILRHFRSIVRLSPFHFEDFCASLLMDDVSALLSEIHISLLKALIREEDAQQTHFGQLDQKDSLNIALYFVDSMTWAETLRVYLQSDTEFKSTLEILNICNYPFTSLQNRLKVLQFLCDQFLQTSVAREDLLSEGKIRYDDHCRVCHKTGDLLCCDSCSAVYHLDCADPPLSNAPLEIEDWTCNICNKHKIEGVTDCSSLMETSGLMCRQEPLGYDRHGRKYWFLVRRIIVESDEGYVWYYSTLEQLDLILLMMDSVDLEEALYMALKEFGDDIRRQMEITEKITDKAKGSRTASITLETEVTRKKIENIQENKRKIKKEEADRLDKIIEEVKSETEIKNDEIKEEKVEDGEDTKDISASMDAPPKQEEEEGAEILKEVKKEDEKGPDEDVKPPPMDSSTPIKKEKRGPKMWDEAETESLIAAKMDQLNGKNGEPFRLGCEHTFRSYCNQYVTNTLSLNKLQHNEERDKKRHLSHKFSLANNSEFKWNGQCHGPKENQVATVRQTLLSLEQNISSHFFHTNWQSVRKAWTQSLVAATTPTQFAKAILWLVSCIKPVVFNNVWHESLGHIRLKRITALDREERKKQEKREKKEADDEARLFPFVKYTKGVKHQLWKVKGEEYRMHGLWGWQWLSCSRRTTHVPMKSVGLRAGPDKITIPIKSNGGLVRGLPINAASYNQLAAKNPSMQFSLLSPNQRKEQETEHDKEKKKEIMLANAGQFEVSAINLEDHFEDGLVNVSNELNSRLRLVYPKLCKTTSIDSFLGRRLALKIQEERDLAKGKKSGKDLKKESDVDAAIDVENDSSDDTTTSDTNHSEGENIEEIPDSQRRLTIHKQRPAGHLLKEMRLHKFKYEALDKMDETLPCYSLLCREGGRSNCYSPSCIFKERTKQKLINSVNNYKIITSKPAPFDNVGSCSPVRLSDPDPEKSPKGDGAADTPSSKPSPSLNNNNNNTLNGQVASSPSSFETPHKKSDLPKDKSNASSDFKMSFDEDSSHSQGSTTSEQKLPFKAERIFSAENSSGKIYLKKSSIETKKSKKHKVPPTNRFRVHLQNAKLDASKEDIRRLHTLFILPSWELRFIARKGGKYNPSGFNPNAKMNQHFWAYPCGRPVFKLTFLYRTSTMSTLNCVAFQLRILWACLRWDDMHEKGPLDGRKQITTDIEIIQTEILKRKVTGRFYEKSMYLRRKVTIPLDVPKAVREFTPSQRSGLRKRRRAQSPVNKQPESLEEWVEEEKLDLWEVRYFGERLEKAASLSKKSGVVEKDSSFHAISRSTSPAEFKAKIEEQLKIQRATFNQKKTQEGQAFGSNKGIVKVAIGNTIPGAAGSKIMFSSTKLMQGTPSIVTVGSKLPSVLSGRKIVTTKGGKIITVQTAGSLLTSNKNDAPQKISLGKSSMFPVSSLPKVQVSSQGNKVIKLQNITAGGQRTILPRVATAVSTSSASIIRPITANTPVSTSQVFSASSPTALQTIRPITSNQQLQFLQMPDGQLHVKGLQEGQQLLQRGDGKLHLVNTKLSIPNTVTSAPQTPIQVTQQTKTFPSKETPLRGITPLTGGQIVKINGQQMILRTGGPNGKQILGVNAKDAAALPTESKVISGSFSTGNLGAPKFKMVKAPEGFTLKAAPPLPANTTTTAVAATAVTTHPKEKQPVVEDKPKPALCLTPPTSPTKGGTPPAASTSPSAPAGVPNAAGLMTLRVQVRMTEQGPKTIIQGLQPGVGLTKDHIMAIQQQVRALLTDCNLQVNQLSPLMTLTLHATKGQPPPPPPPPAQGIKPAQPPPPANQLSPVKTISTETNKPIVSNDKVNSDIEKPVDLLGMKELSSESKENSQNKFVLTTDYIQQSIKSALNKNDLTPDVEEKLMHLQKFTTSKTKVKDSLSLSPQDATSPTGKSTKRTRDQDENDWESEGTPARSKFKKAKSDKPKSKKDPSAGVAVVSSKTQMQDARKKLARQQKLEVVLAKHKDLLKKDILKKRALLEKELQLQIHKELSVAKQHIQILEKIKTSEPTTTSVKKAKHESTIPSQSLPTAREVSKPKKADAPSTLMTSGSSASKMGKNASSSKNKNKSGKGKSKKIVCICRTTFDDSKFYVGCDLCGNWFHGDCIGITETLSRSMKEYVCDDCANAKLNKDLFCFCKQPYDETQFYICCDKCEGWYHGKCIGIMQAEAEDIDDYICPKCEPDNQWNRACQKKLANKDYVEVKKVSKMLIQHKNAWPFLEPVDQSEVPDYYKVVKIPMDLKAVDKKVSQHKYNSLFQFVGDVMLVFDNCRAYNPPNSSFCSCAHTLELFFCLKLKQLKIKIAQRT